MGVNTGPLGIELDVVDVACRIAPVTSGLVAFSAATAATSALATSAVSFGGSLGVASLRMANAKSQGGGAVASAMAIVMGAQRFAASSGVSADASPAYQSAVGATAWASGDFRAKADSNCGVAEIVIDGDIDDVDDEDPTIDPTVSGSTSTPLDSTHLDILDLLIPAASVCDSLARIMLVAAIAMVITLLLHALVLQLWKRTVNHRWYLLRRWRLVALRPVRFIPFPSIFVFPGLQLIIFSVFLTGLAQRAMTIVTATSCSGDTCVACLSLAWTALAMIAVFFAVAIRLLIMFNIRYRSATWRLTQRAASSQAVNDPIFRMLSMLCSLRHRLVVDLEGPKSERGDVVIQRFHGKFERADADLREPARTERLLAAPCSFSRRVTSDAVDAYGYSLLARASGSSSRTASFELIVLGAQVTVGLINGIGSAEAKTRMVAVLIVQACSALWILLTLPSADRMQAVVVGMQFCLESCQTAFLLVDPAREQASIMCALGALFAPVVLQLYDFFTQLLRVKDMSCKTVLLTGVGVVCLLPKVVLRLLGWNVVDSGVMDVAEHGGTDAHKLAERDHEEALETRRARKASAAEEELEPLRRIRASAWSRSTLLVRGGT